MVKKAGRFLLCFAPLAVFLCGQLCIAFLLMNVFLRCVGAKWHLYFMEIIALTYVGLFLVMGLWYLLGWKRNPSVRTLAGFLRPGSLARIVGMALGCYLLTAAFLGGMHVLLPDVMQHYNSLMEEMGVETLGGVAALCTLLLAPMVEELTFRGLTLSFAKRAGIGFAAANLLQAVLFGVAHLNPVQGLYAAALGLLLGYVTHRRRSLYPAILLHAIFNFFGSYGSAWLDTHWVLGMREYLFCLILGMALLVWTVLRLVKSEDIDG